MEKIDNRYHVVLMVGAVLTVLASLVFGIWEVSYQMGDQFFAISQFPLILFTILGVKAFIYYSTRTYPYAPSLCWFDVFLSLFLVFTMFYFGRDGFIGNDLNADGSAIFALIIAFWVLTQLFLGVNYFILLLTWKKW